MINKNDPGIQNKIPKILIVDDDANFLLGVSRILAKNHWEVITAHDGQAGIYKAETEHPDLIVLDVNMPGMNGFQVRQALGRIIHTGHIPVIFLTALADRISTLNGLCLAEDFITKPVDPGCLIASISVVLKKTENERRQSAYGTEKLIHSDKVDHLGMPAELQENSTAGHAMRVTAWFEVLARRFGIHGIDLENAKKGSLLHEIGSLSMIEDFLSKPNTLSADEWKVMRKHPSLARDMLNNISNLQSAMDIPHSHRERWDGRGQPAGLKGDSIPLAVRIFCVVDAYDTLRIDRSGGPGLNNEKVFKILRAESGRQFDPRVVVHFLTHFQIIRNEAEHIYPNLEPAIFNSEVNGLA
jgi:putative two-component system response regulator